MTLTRLILKEFLHSRLNVALSVTSVAVAACCLTAALASLKLHDLRTEEILSLKQKETEVRVAKLEDDYRVIMKQLGFNVLILPQGQNLGDFYAKGFAEATMPEEYVYRLASNSIITVRHLLPSLQQKVDWVEQKRTVLVMGIRDEVPIAEKQQLEKIIDAVVPGTAVLGHELASSIGLKKDDEFMLLGKTFKVAETHAERGNMDDITIWLNLGEAQTLLGKEGRINGILALECACAWADIGKVRREITNILPQTQVIESGSDKALTRAEARYRAAEEAQTALKDEENHRNGMRQEQENFAAVLVPAVILVCALWLSLLSFSNVKERRYEIALLRALGMHSRGILVLFLSKAGIIGFCGALIGGLLGPVLIALKVGDIALLPSLTSLLQLLILVIGAVVLSEIAGWPPALFACAQDPADILREE
jgi:putative ABC transport system permease protein